MTRRSSTAQDALHERVMKDLQGFKKMGSESFQKVNFMKRNKGNNIFRIIRPIDGPICLPFKQHKGTRFGNFGTAMNLDYLYNPEQIELREEMESRNRVDDEDYELWNEHKDPFTVCFQTLKAFGKEDIWKNIGSQRIWFVVIQDEEVLIFETSPSFNEQFLDLYEENPSIVEIDEGQDINTKGKGDGFAKKNARRYNPPILVGDPYQIEVTEEDIPNLYDAIGSKILGFADKVDFLFESHPKLRAAAGLNYDDFGLVPPEEDEEDEEDEE